MTLNCDTTYTMVSAEYTLRCLRAERAAAVRGYPADAPAAVNRAANVAQSTRARLSGLFRMIPLSRSLPAHSLHS